MKSKSSKKTVYAPLKTQKEYLKLIASSVVNRFGDSIDAIAYSLLTYEITGSAALMAFVLAINYLPTVILQPIAGVVTEKMNPVRLMSLCDLGRGVCVLTEAALYAMGLLTTPLILLGVLINSTLEALSTPAGVGIVPRLLSEELYTAGIALRKTLSSTMELIGLACAGAIVGALGISAALAIDAGTFLISAALIACIRPAPLEAAPGEEENARLASKISHIAHELRGVFVQIARTPLLRAVVLLGMALNFTAVPYSVFFTPYVTTNLGGDAYALSLLQIAFVVGMMIGSYVTPHLDRLSARVQILIGGFGAALCYLAMAVFPSVAPYTLRLALTCCDTFVFGAFNAMLSIAFSAAFMRSTPTDQLTRTSGAVNAVLTCAMPVGALLCSALVSFISVPAMLAFGGLLCLTIFAAMSRMRAYNNL
ncbi:MAG: MFS transporter [Candidatus Ventricola sp.]